MRYTATTPPALTDGGGRRWISLVLNRAAGNASFAGLSGPLVSGIRLLWVGVGGGGQNSTAGGVSQAPLCCRLWIQHPESCAAFRLSMELSKR